MINILNLKKDIVKVLFYGNLFFLIVAIWNPTKAFFIILTIINSTLLGTLMVITKYTDKFTEQFQKMWGK